MLLTLNCIYCMITVERGDFVNLNVSVYSDKPIYEQLKDQLKKAIINGELEKHYKLPSVRVLSKELQIGIVTVKRAYDDLVNEGFVFSQSARGYFVSEIDIDKVQDMYLSRINNLFDEVMRLKDDADIDFQVLEEIFKHKGEEKNE